MFRVGLRKKTNDGAQRRDTRFEGIEEYVLGDYTVDWDVAEQKTFAKARLFWLGDFLGYGPNNVLVATTEDGYFGASVILSDDVVRKAKEMICADKLIMIPSSVHEVLLLKYDEQYFDTISSFVAEVNEAEVAPEERLGDHAYII